MRRWWFKLLVRWTREERAYRSFSRRLSRCPDHDRQMVMVDRWWIRHD